MKSLLFKASSLLLLCLPVFAANEIYITQVGTSNNFTLDITQDGDDNLVQLSVSHDDNNIDIDQTVTGTSTGSNIISWVTYWGSGESWGGDLDGSGNEINIEQWQNKGNNTNRVGFHIPTNDNTVNICQGGIFSSFEDTDCGFDTNEYGGHTANIDLHSGGAELRISQTTGTSSNRSEGHYLQVYTYGGEDADVFVQQRGNGDKKAYITIRTDDSVIDMMQKSDGDHTATVDLTGSYGTDLTLKQDSQSDQTYSLTNNCQTPGGCTVNVTQN